jgi:hypothetical protein
VPSRPYEVPRPFIVSLNISSCVECFWRCRYDRRKEREREWRLEELERKGVKKSKITRDKDRDISERIALGLAAPTVISATSFSVLIATL